MIFVKGLCIKCGGNPIFSVNEETTYEQLLMKLNIHDLGHCTVGWHVEIGKMIDYYLVDWNTRSETETDAARKEAFPKMTQEELELMVRENRRKLASC